MMRLGIAFIYNLAVKRERRMFSSPGWAEFWTAKHGLTRSGFVCFAANLYGHDVHDLRKALKDKETLKYWFVREWNSVSFLLIHEPVPDQGDSLQRMIRIIVRWASISISIWPIFIDSALSKSRFIFFGGHKRRLASLQTDIIRKPFSSAIHKNKLDGQILTFKTLTTLTNIFGLLTIDSQATLQFGPTIFPESDLSVFYNSFEWSCCEQLL